MITPPAQLRDKLREFGQEHVLACWDRLSDSERQASIEQLRSIDLALLRRLYQQRDQGHPLPQPERIAPVPVARLDATDETTRQAGEQALRRGEVAVLVVAGGQGSRLGHDVPKGMFEVGPVSNKSLFQIHAEKVLALGRRYGKSILLLVMTSPATDAETSSVFCGQS